jgi:hypothetical protein
MGGKSRTSVTKRQKEQARQQRRQVKEQRREQRSLEKGTKPEGAADGEDPDIAGIVAGPQPHPFADELEAEPGEGEEKEQ